MEVENSSNKKKRKARTEYMPSKRIKKSVATDFINNINNKSQAELRDMILVIFKQKKSYIKYFKVFKSYSLYSRNPQNYNATRRATLLYKRSLLTPPWPVAPFISTCNSLRCGVIGRGFPRKTKSLASAAVYLSS